MKKQKTWIFALVLLILLLLLGGFLAFYVHQKLTENTPREKTFNEDGIRTFADWTNVEVFQDVPAMIVEDTKIGNASDFGQGAYGLTVNGTTKENYEDYLQLLEAAGFVRYVDNGEEGLAGSIYTATFQKENLTLTVTHVVKVDITYVVACFDQPLSEHLIYQDSYVAGNIEGKQTTVTMLELFDYGNSFVIQLKNGHFIVNDGGTQNDIPYLIDYLESLTPDGEKPVVEAWFISHAHGDHMGILSGLARESEYLERIYVDGFYYNVPNDLILNKYTSNGLSIVTMAKTMITGAAKASDGSASKIYRPQSGQRYYFDDIVIEVLHTQEQLASTNYANVDLNDSSIWLSYLIEGQKFLLCGDADRGSMTTVMRNYDADYFKLDVFALFHHNMNTWIPFTEMCEFKTLLYTCNKKTPQNTKAGTAGELNSPGGLENLEEKCEEGYSWENGAVVLSFPYKVGTAKILPPCKWQYNEEHSRTFN